MFGQGKDLPRIAMAHEIPYVATATVADCATSSAKVEKAMSMRGARYLHVLVPCRSAGPRPPQDTIRLARLATQSGLFPVFEAEHGLVTATTPIRHRVPVEDYLTLQGRFAHLFGPDGRPDVVARIQAGRTATSTGTTSLTAPDGATVTEHDLPFAITLAPATSRADLTGRCARSGRCTSTRQAPCGSACPAGEAVRDWLYDAEEGDAGYERAWRRIMEPNPFPAVMGRVCYHPCETSCNRGQLDQSVGINSVERFLGDRALELGWSPPPAGPPTGRKGAGRRRRAPPGSRRRTTWSGWGHEVVLKEAESPVPAG